MTREEAIERIKSYKRYLMGGNPIWSVEEVAKAFDMAIEALKTEPTGDLISRQDAIEAVDETWWNARGIRKAIESLPSADTDMSKYSDRLWEAAYERGKAEGYMSTDKLDYCNNCPYISWDGDFISRSEILAGIDTTDDNPWDTDEVVAMIENAPSVTSKPIADCISRQQVTDEIKRWRGYLDEDIIERINTRMNMIPPATPTEQREHGRLIDADRLLQETFTVDEEEWTTPEIRAILENALNITPTEPSLKQTDTLLIADALRYLMQDTNRHLADRTRADALREQMLEYGASMRKPLTSKSDLISRADAIDAVANALWHYPNQLYKNFNKYEVAWGVVSDALRNIPIAIKEDREVSRNRIRAKMDGGK